jgi:NADPH2:quinone reductase
MQRMKCVEIPNPGGPEALVLGERPIPVPAPGQVLIRVEAAGVNRPDIIQREGKYPPPPGASDIPGLEVAGSIEAVGDKVTNWRVGDKVCALVTGGGYAQYCLAEASICLPPPKGLDMISAASLPETVFTVWHNVFERCALKSGETFLVHGGSSGIGVAAIQMARALGATVFATAGSAGKCAACIEFGATHAIDYKKEDFAAVIAKLTGKSGVDVILDMVGGDYIAKNIKCLATDGRMSIIAFLKGPVCEANFMPIMLKRLTITGSTLRVQSTAKKAAMAAEIQEKIWPLFADDSIRPVVHRIFPLEEAANAHRLMESGVHVGKIMLAANE